MDQAYVHAAAVLGSALFILIAIFQLLLALGFPLGEWTMGGFHKGRLSGKLRAASTASLLVLLFFAAVTLDHANVVSFGLGQRATNVLVWVICGYLFLNTAANLFSRSVKEKRFMTPLSGVAALALLLVAVYA